MQETPAELLSTSEDAVSDLRLPVEAPLTIYFDSETGTLRLRTVILNGPDDRQLVRLQLDFSAEAAHGFISTLRAVENELGVVISQQRRSSLAQ